MSNSSPHSILACDMRPVNAPGEDEEWVYIVPEADLKQLVEQLQAALLQIEFLEERHEALGKTYDELHGRLDEFSQSADFYRRENERLLEQLEAARKQLQEQYEALKRDAKIKERALTDYFADASRRADDLQEQLEATEQRLAREISEHADREQALRQLQFLAVNGQNQHSNPMEALREIESRAREALYPASGRVASGDAVVASSVRARPEEHNQERQPE